MANPSRLPQGAFGPLRGEKTEMGATERLHVDPRSRDWANATDVHWTKLLFGSLAIVGAAFALRRSFSAIPTAVPETRGLFVSGRGHRAEKKPWKAPRGE